MQKSSALGSIDREAQVVYNGDPQVYKIKKQHEVTHFVTDLPSLAPIKLSKPFKELDKSGVVSTYKKLKNTSYDDDM